MGMKKVFLQVVLAICILAALVFGTLIIRELYIDGQSESFYSEVASEIRRRPDDPVHADAEETEDTQAVRPGNTSSTAMDWIPYMDFVALNSKFPGAVAWIKLEDSLLDYPVMQHTDNDRFLRYLPDGTPHRSGSIFLDYRNKNDFTDKSILIYGHETRVGNMFGALKNYRNQAFYEENPVINLYTPYNDHKIILFAGHIAHSVIDHPPLEFEDDDEFMNYIEHIRSVSVFNSDVEVTADDRIVSLVTCTYDFSDARLIIVGILG